MLLVAFIIILSASAALCSRWGADTVWGGYTKCMIYENTNPKTKINPKAYESITKYNSNGLPICDVSYTSDGRLMDSVVYQYSDNGKKKEGINYDLNGNIKSKTSLIRNGNVISEQIIKYSGVKESILNHTAILDKCGNKIESSSYNGNDEQLYLYWPEHEILKYDEKNNIISRIHYINFTPTDSNKSETIFKPVYDTLGRLIEYSWFGSDGKLEKINAYEYSTDGSKIDTEKNFRLGDYINLITKYNKQGKVTEIISLTPSGLRKKILTMEYDEFGNLIKRNIYSNDKDEVERTIEYVYSK